MITEQLLNPGSIVVIGGSNNLYKPGGRVLKNLIDGEFKGKLYVTNLKEEKVQGIKSFRNIEDLPEVDLAIIAIAAKYCPATVEVLVKKKNAKAFIIISAGFSEENEVGAQYEKEIVEVIDSVNGSLIGPNCIGVLNNNYNGVFTTPIPKLDPNGCDFISGSGATAVFTMETGMKLGLTFAGVYSIGNSAQMGVEEILKHMDENFDPDISPKVKLLYLEKVEKPDMFLKHTSSLIRKGCKIAAIKSGASEEGSRAASSHTGALATSDIVIRALFKKAGIVYCSGREELITCASIFMHNEMKGKNIAVITHAGGSAVMLTDSLSRGNLEVPKIDGPESQELLKLLNPGSSVSNPIDFLATGTAEHLGLIIDYCENKFDNIDGMVVVFGSPGLFDVTDVYEMLNEKMNVCKKPIYPVLPSVINAEKAIEHFVKQGRIFFPDEVVLGTALTEVFKTEKPAPEKIDLPDLDTKTIRSIIDKADNGYLMPKDVQALLDASGIPRVEEAVAKTKEEAVFKAMEYGLPVVMKVVGPVHKTDVGGVVINIRTLDTVAKEFERMIQIKDCVSIVIQPMIVGTELFAGAKHESNFGHMVLCGLGGVFIEILKDVSAGLAPLSRDEVYSMIHSLKSYGIIKGTRGLEPVNENVFADIVIRVSALVNVAPEIAEMDLNPLMGTRNEVKAVDARIKIEK